jgi:ribosomal protein S18 acetylase RimI-like enzyme
MGRQREPAVTLRPLTAADADAARELLGQLGFHGTSHEMRGRIERVLADATHFAVVAEADGRVAGLVHAFERPALEKPCEVVVQSLAVRPDAQRLGIGRMLMEAVERFAAAHGSGSVALHTRHGEPFYEKLRYEILATPHFMRRVL